MSLVAIVGELHSAINNSPTICAESLNVKGMCVPHHLSYGLQMPESVSSCGCRNTNARVKLYTMSEPGVSARLPGDAMYVLLGALVCGSRNVS